MPRRGWLERVDDMLEAIDRIQQYTDGMSFEQFRDDAKTIDAVIRNLTVIGEAACHIPVEVEDAAGRVPWANMRGIRNVVVHEYFGVSLSILWETVQHDLQPLVEPLQCLRRDTDAL